MRTIDPKNSNWKNWKNRCRIIRFESIFYDFCEFLRIFPKNQIRHRQKTGDDLEYVPLLFCHLVYTVSLLDTVEKWNQKQWNCIEWLIKGGPVPSILDDLCLGNVISKYFSKLRVGTSKIQPELKCLENVRLSFCESLLRARLWEHELFSVRSIAFISTLVKSPDEACIKHKAFYTRYSRECHISALVSTSLSLAHSSLVSEPYRGPVPSPAGYVHGPGYPANTYKLRTGQWR